MTTIYTTKLLPKRADFDFYATPRRFCDAALRLVSFPQNALVMDAGAGTGVWGQAFKAQHPDSIITGIDVRRLTKPKGYSFWYTGNFLDSVPAPTFHAVIGNPPYNVAEEFITHSLAYLQDGGQMVLLLRLAFLESIKRFHGLYATTPPKLVTVSASRISYTGNGKSNATAYAVYVWEKGYAGKTELSWFDWKGA